MTNTTAPIPLLLPDQAFQILLVRYIMAGSCAIIIWDILNNLKNDYTLFFKYHVKLPTVVYIISRLSTLGYVLADAILATAPIKRCAQFALGVHILMTIANSATSLLFFFRVRAIYEGNKYVGTFFAFMWLAVLVGCILTTRGLAQLIVSDSATHCIPTSMPPYLPAAGVIPLVNDTMVFLAISCRLVKNSVHHLNIQYGVRAMFFGDYMPAFSRALLQDGQMYYLTTISTGLLAVIMLFIRSLPVTYRSMFLVPNFMLMNIMACRVFRNTKFGIFPENGISSVNVPTLPLTFGVKESLV